MTVKTAAKYEQINSPKEVGLIQLVDRLVTMLVKEKGVRSLERYEATEIALREAIERRRK